MKVPELSTLLSLHRDPRILAAILHAHAGKFYDGHAYVHHLDMVFTAYAWRLNFSCGNHMVNEFAIYFHDIIEDCGLTYNDVLAYAKAFVRARGGFKPEEVEAEAIKQADAVYRLTNLRGKTRKERQSDEWYDSLVQSPLAVKIKYADKFANLTHSIEVGSSMADVYRREWPEFHRKIMHRITPAVDSDLRNELIAAWNVVEEKLNK